MSKKRLGMASIEVNKKFTSEEEANRYAKNLVSAIRYICMKKADKGWFAQAMVVSSNLMKGVSLLEYQSNGKRGRPKKVLRINERMANVWYKGNYKTDWHLHILIVAKPIYAFRDAIKEYIDKNWGKIAILNDVSKSDTINFEILKVYKKDCNIKIADYFINQSSKVLFCDCNYGKEEKLKYSLKQYHNEYLKVDSAKKRLHHQHRIKPLTEEKFIQKLDKIERKFKIIENYFYNITKDEKDNEEREYMKKVQLSKMAENYNKVQNIHHKRILDNNPF